MSTAGTALGLDARADYGMTRTVAIAAFVLAYQLGRVAGSIALPPWTETFGRKKSYIVSMFVYTIATLIVGVVPHLAGAIVGRVVSGVMSVAGSTVAVGAFQEMFGTEGRVWAVYTWAACSIAALAVGSIYGCYISEVIGWRWGFYIAAIISTVLTVLCFFVRETRISCILRAQIDRVQQETGTSDLYCKATELPGVREFLQTTLFRPMYFFFTEPIVMTVVTLSSIAWSLIFLFSESLTIVYSLYGFSTTETSLFFIPILIGVILSAPFRIRDIHAMQKKTRHNETAKPEDKLLAFAIGAPALATGLWWFAWTTPQAVHTHWIVPSLGLVLVGFAISEMEYVLAGYLADSYGIYTSSAVGSLAVMQSIFGGSLPLFAYFMYTGISTNAASSILAGVATVFCIAPVVFIRYGEKLRSRSPYARFSVQAS